MKFVYFAEHDSKTSDIKETAPKDKNRSKLGSLLLQVKILKLIQVLIWLDIFVNIF